MTDLEPGKVCIWAVHRSPGQLFCGARGVAVRPVPARERVNEAGDTVRIPAHELTLCAEHVQLFDAGRTAASDAAR